MSNPLVKQSIFEVLLIMAYNCGRDHERMKTFPIDEGRERVVESLKRFVEDAKKGDLDDPFVDLLERRGDDILKGMLKS